MQIKKAITQAINKKNTKLVKVLNLENIVHVLEQHDVRNEERFPVS